MRDRLRRLGYTATRRLLIAGGLVILILLVALMHLRDVDRVEVIATALFIPIFLAFVTWNLKGGLIAGVLAAGAYVALRYPAIDAVGAGRFAGMIASRSLGLLAFGAIGGAANQVVEASLQKLELYDQIDDATGLFNARFFLEDTDLEVSRSKRYKTVFSIAVVDFPMAALEGLNRRQRNAIGKDLGRQLSDSVRDVDRAVHVSDEKRHRLAVVMPETGPEGARIFTERLHRRISDYLRSKGASLDEEDLDSRSITYPEDGDPVVQQLRSEFAEIGALEGGAAPTRRESSAD